LTVGLVTSPFSAEGPRRFQQASDGIAEMKNHVDTLLVISNDKLREIHGNLTLSAAFSQADDILSNAAKSIAEIITVPGYVNVDFEDVNTVMRNSGVAIMGMASFEGENRGIKAVETALNSPLLNDNHIRGAKNILVNITSGSVEVTLDEVSDITEFIQREAGFETNIIWGNCYSESQGEKLSVTVIATGFEATSTQRKDISKLNMVKHSLEAETKDEPESKNQTERKAPFYMPSEREGITPELPFEFDISEKTFNSSTLKIELQEDQENNMDEPLPDDFILREKPAREMLEERNQPVAETPDISRSAAKDRVSKLRNLSFKLTNPAAINEMEKEPAYLRRGINLKDVDHSSDSNLSPYYLENSDDPEQLPTLKKNNSFLHGNDRVD
ncbi:MAG: cell division protein FtsZ, partial [Chitinophagales bacterium]|nr:cell division protein FtsZ [Chitinophagales bacterium]